MASIILLKEKSPVKNYSRQTTDDRQIHLRSNTHGCELTNKKYIYAFTLYAHNNLHSYFFSVNIIKFNWVGANTNDVVLLNDLNYNEEAVRKWMPFLNLLEGALVHYKHTKKLSVLLGEQFMDNKQK